jgi:hypothetical protein
VSAPQKLTPDQIRWAREIVAKRRDLQRQLDMYPNMQQIAEKLEVSVRYMFEVVNNRARTADCSTGNIIASDRCA